MGISTSHSFSFIWLIFDIYVHAIFSSYTRLVKKSKQGGRHDACEITAFCTYTLYFTFKCLFYILLKIISTQNLALKSVQ